MPTYEYACPRGHEFELIQKMSDKPHAKCPVCGKPATRKMSGGAGLVFKGTGFYITDYGKDGKGPAKDPSKKEGGDKAEAKSETASDTQPAKAEKPVAKDAPKDAPSKGEGKGKK